MNVMLNCKDAG